MPYFCPAGWVRKSLKVCEDGDFEQKYGGKVCLYHGTTREVVGSILASGFQRTREGFSGAGVYMSPSIEYCAHPMKAAKPISIEYCAHPMKAAKRAMKAA